VSSRNPSYVVAVGQLAAIGIMAAIGAESVVLRTLLAAPLVLYLPGFVILRALFPEARVDIEQTAFAIGLSMAITVLCGLLLHVVGFLTPLGWALSLGGITIAVCAAGRFAPLPDPPMRPSDWQRALGFNRSQLALLACAVAISLSSIYLARQGALAHREYAFTEFWLVPNEAKGRNVFTVGLKNEEKVPATYDVEVMVDGRMVQAWRSILVPAGQQYSADAAVPLEPTRVQRVEAWLFKGGNDRLVYRKAWAATPASATAGATARAPPQSVTE